MVLIQEMITMEDILIKGVVDPLEGHLGEVILLKEIFSFPGGDPPPGDHFNGGYDP